jgi:DNA-binding transcriptional MerR regulator
MMRLAGVEVTFKPRIEMRIAELSAESGVPASTIHYWEKIGVPPRPIRVAGQHRYSSGGVQRLAVLRRPLHGFAPGVTPPRRWQDLTRRKREELDQQIVRFQTMRQPVADCARLAASVTTECPR